MVKLGLIFWFFSNLVEGKGRQNLSYKAYIILKSEEILICWNNLVFNIFVVCK